MAKPDMPYGLFPWLVPLEAVSASAPLAVDLATVMKWYWRVRAWTATMSGSFSVTVPTTENSGFGPNTSSTVTFHAALSVTETFDVLGPGLDELYLCLGIDPPLSSQQYLWVARPSPIVSCNITAVDSLGVEYGPGTALLVQGDPPRTMFCPGRSNPPYDDGWSHMTRDPSSGLFTPFLGDGGSGGGSGGGPLWLGGSWAQIQGTIGATVSAPPGYSGIGGTLVIDIQSTSAFSGGFFGGVSFFPGAANVLVAGSVEGHTFSANGFCEWGFEGYVSEAVFREPTGATYNTDGVISLTITPATPGGYWPHAPRNDPGHPTYDADSGAIANNPATGAPWTPQEIISRQGP